jgi:ligand-binding SRPBCC domain-containing protein
MSRNGSGTGGGAAVSFGRGAGRNEFVLRTVQVVPQPRHEVFEFFSLAENLERITPPELGFSIQTSLPIEMRVGALIDYRLKLHGLPLRWRTEITAWVPGVEFEDTQLRGPYTQWIHRHRFFDEPGGGTRIEDEVRYVLPFGPLGRLAHPIVRMQLRRIFAHRESAVRARFGE